MTGRSSLKLLNAEPDIDPPTLTKALSESVELTDDNAAP